MWHHLGRIWQWLEGPQVPLLNRPSESTARARECQPTWRRLCSSWRPTNYINVCRTSRRPIATLCVCNCIETCVWVVLRCWLGPLDGKPTQIHNELEYILPVNWMKLLRKQNTIVSYEICAGPDVLKKTNRWIHCNCSHIRKRHR